MGNVTSLREATSRTLETIRNNPISNIHRIEIPATHGDQSFMYEQYREIPLRWSLIDCIVRQGSLVNTPSELMEIIPFGSAFTVEQRGNDEKRRFWRIRVRELMRARAVIGRTLRNQYFEIYGMHLNVNFLVCIMRRAKMLYVINNNDNARTLHYACIWLNRIRRIVLFKYIENHGNDSNDNNNHFNNSLQFCIIWCDCIGKFYIGQYGYVTAYILIHFYNLS